MARFEILHGTFEPMILASSHASFEPPNKPSVFPCTHDALAPKDLPTMKRILQIAPLLIATLILGSAQASTNETAESAAEPEPGVAVKVEKAVERGATAAVNGAKRGVNAAVRGIETGATAAANGIERGAKAAVNGVERGVKATGNAVQTVAEKISGSPPPPPSPPPDD